MSSPPGRGTRALPNRARRAGDSRLIPRVNEHLNMLLEVHLLEQELSELGFELRNRLDWAKIPLRSILRLLEFPL